MGSSPLFVMRLSRTAQFKTSTLSPKIVNHRLLSLVDILQDSRERIEDFLLLFETLLKLKRVALLKVFQS